MFTRILFLFILLFASVCSGKTYTYFGVSHDSYELTLLAKALEQASSEPVELEKFDGIIPKFRAFQIMQNGEGIDIIIAGATQERAAKSLPIHFPIFKGLFGLRVSLVNNDDIDIFKDVHTLDDLSAFIAGQFHTWSDTRILRHNGITVASGSDTNGLYMMLHKGRYDFFPRSVLEVQWNLQEHQDLNLAIEPYTLIQYPKAHYFHVQPSNESLANLIESGLETLHQNGEIDSLFDAAFGETLQQLRLHSRRVIPMENPDLPQGTPLERDDLWLDLHSYAHQSQEQADADCI